MRTTLHAPIEVDLNQPSVDERRALIERVAASEHFRRSARLRDFILYVGRQSLKKSRPEINEQEVGAHVFGRPAAYDRSQDNIVRVNATELRKRIDAYFETEGAHESLVLEIPRGGYKPVFHRRGLQAQAPPLAVAPGLLAPAVSNPENSVSVAAVPRSRAHLLWASACLVLAAAVLFLIQQNRTLRTTPSGWDGKPALASFWEAFLSYRRPTDIVLPDDSFSVIQDITHRPVSLGDYLDRSYMRDIQASNYSADRKTDLTQIFGHNLVTFGGIRAADRIRAVLPASSSAKLTLSRYYLADSIKQDNVILVGGMKANPWVHLFDDKTNFSLRYDGAHALGFILNRNPRPGEQTQYSSTMDPDGFVGYSALAYLPNPSGTGNAIILAGTDSDATDAAAEFLTSESNMEKFRNNLHVKTLPYFEVLLKTSRLSGTAFNSQVLAYRTYP